jgi:flagella basal body P-ring formation protein FlgA
MILSAIFAMRQVVWADVDGIEREVHLKTTAEVRSQEICMGDLVEDGWLQSRCAIDLKTCCKWTLQGQRSGNLSRTAIERELSKMKLSGFSLKLKGPEQVTITQTWRELSTAEIKTKLISAIAAKIGEEQKNISVASLNVVPAIYVNLSQESDWEVSLPENLLDQMRLRIVSTTNPSNVLGWVTTELSIAGDAFIAKKTIHPLETVNLADFELHKVNILALQASGQNYFRKDQFPEGTRARQTVLKGHALLASAIERVPLVRLGDMVTLVLRSDSLKIATKGIVQGNAAPGDMVTVQLSKYNRTFRGKLNNERIVEVWL